MTQSRRVWVLGASRGIGAAVARALSHHQLVVSARSESTLQTLATSMNSPTVVVHPCDVTDLASLDAVHAAINATHGPIDVLVYCAGIGTFAPLVDLTSNDLDQHLAVNVRGLFHALKLVIPGMTARQYGQIVNINSVAVLEPFANCSVYGASKAAARAMLRSLRTEVRADGVKVTDIYVGATDTDIWPSAARSEHGHRMMSPTDVANVVASVIDHSLAPQLHLEEILLRPQGGDL